MDTWVLALIVKPVVLFALCFLVLYPARMAVKNYMAEGKVKRLLLATNQEKKVLFCVIIALFYVCLFGAASVMF